MIDTTYGIATLKGLEGLFANVISIVLGLSGIVLFFMLVSGGFKYLTSGGDSKGMEGAGHTITSAITGIVVLILSLLILRIIENFTGVKLTIFRIFLK
jgi:hypothetical protein